MKRLFVLLVTSIILFPTWAKSSGYHYFGDFGYIYIDLNENAKRYYISYSYNTSDDLLSGMTLSSGNFRHVSNNEILFEDEITGITMKAIKIKNVALVLSSTYELLDNKTFHVKDTSDSAEDQLAVFNGEYSKVVDKRVSSTNGDDSGLISDGLWRSNIITLTIMDEQFRYSIKDKVYAETWYESGKPWYFIDIKILQGTWSQDGNLITLHDEHTGHDFYLIYEYPNLRTMLLPGDWSLDGTVLTPR